MEVWAKDALQENGEQSDSDDQVSGKRITKQVEMKQQKASRSRSEKRVCSKRIRRLRKMIPKGESMELNGLFRETDDYIVCLQMKVRMMQALVHVLNGSDE